MPAKPPVIERVAKEAADAMAAECVAMRTRRLSRLITSVYAAELHGLDLGATQVTILAILVKAGPLGPARLSAWLALEKSSVSRTVERMAQRGWLAIEQGADGRSHELAITAAGKRKLAEAYPHWQSAQERVAALLGMDGVQMLCRVSDAALAAQRQT